MIHKHQGAIDLDCLTDRERAIYQLGLVNGALLRDDDAQNIKSLRHRLSRVERDSLNKFRTAMRDDIARVYG